MAEYALRDVGKPIGISGFKLAESLPESLRVSLPTIADLEAELSVPGPDMSSLHDEKPEHDEGRKAGGSKKPSRKRKS